MNSDKILFALFIMFIALLGGIGGLSLRQNMKSPEERRQLKPPRYSNIIWVISPLFATIPFAILFSIDRSFTSLLTYGSISIAVNYFIVGIYCYKRREEILKDRHSRIEQMLILFSLLVPFSTIYAMYCFLFSQ